MSENISMKFHTDILLCCLLTLLHFAWVGGIPSFLLSFKFVVVQNILEFNLGKLTFHLRFCTLEPAS